jgi:ketosteroid isomerase-like protein
MIRKVILSLLLVLATSSCTKEVREDERKSAKTADEAAVRELIENYTTSYNAGDIDTAIEMIDANYRGVVADSSDIVGQEAMRNDLLQYRRLYPEGRWVTKIEEVLVSDGYAYVTCTSSFMMPHPIELKPSPVYSERSMRVLKKDKNLGWKIYRYLATPTFTYD